MAPQQQDSLLGREVYPAELPQRPQPAAYAAPSSRPRSPRTRLDEAYSEKDFEPTAARYHHPSISTGGAPSTHTDNSIDLEKQALSVHTREGHERWSQHSSLHSPERTRPYPAESMVRVGGGNDSSPHHQTIRPTTDDGGESDEQDSSRGPKPVRLLLYFLLLLPFLAFAISIWTLLVTILLTLTYPMRLIITRKRSYTDVILSALASSLNLHLQNIGTFPTAGAELQLAQTLAVLLSSSVLSIGISMWAGILGVYWVFAAIIGNPDGLDGRSDGKELVFSTKRKWDEWLRLSVKPSLRS